MYIKYLVMDGHDYLNLKRTIQESVATKENHSLRIIRTDEIINFHRLQEIIKTETPSNDSLVIIIQTEPSPQPALANVYDINGFLGRFSFKNWTEILERIESFSQQYLRLNIAR